MKDCSAIKVMFEALCDYNSTQYKYNKTITQFKKAESKPASAEYYLDAAGERIPLWYDEGETTLYYYLEAGKKMSLRTSDNENDLFANMKEVTYIETSDFDTSKVTNMRGMFGACSSLASLDLSKFDTSKVTDMSSMFSDCSSLTTIYASDKFVTNNVTGNPNMFIACNNLKGGAGTVFDSNHKDKEYASIDGGTENPGYFTAKQ